MYALLSSQKGLGGIVLFSIIILNENEILYSSATEIDLYEI